MFLFLFNKMKQINIVSLFVLGACMYAVCNASDETSSTTDAVETNVTSAVFTETPAHIDTPVPVIPDALAPPEVPAVSNEPRYTNSFARRRVDKIQLAQVKV
jgi:hypothetical protein